MSKLLVILLTTLLLSFPALTPATVTSVGPKLLGGPRYIGRQQVCFTTCTYCPRKCLTVAVPTGLYRAGDRIWVHRDTATGAYLGISRRFVGKGL